MDRRPGAVDVAVVGGGLAGLAAAAYLARAGRSVAAFEKAPALGGRAQTQERDGFLFNAGGHALYRAGRAAVVLRELGVGYRGGAPRLGGGRALRRDRLHALPVGFASLLATGLLPLRAKREAARVLGALPRTDPAPWRRRSLGQWLEATVSSVEVRELLLALARLATFTHDPDRVSAGAVLEQLRLGRKGVLYLHGGWQTLVEGLRQVAVAAGAQVVTAAPVTSVERNTAVTGLRLADGARVRARAVVIAAGGPREALRLLGDGAAPSLAAWAAATVPVKAACLDVALARLPRPRALFALGIDAPLYASVHSAVARLAPTGGALLHTLRYRSPDGPADARGDERELERLLDRLQPGWRDHVVDRRFLPDMTVSHALVTAPGGGTGGRPGTPIAEVPGVFIAGDWVGDEGLLADAALASARRAAGSVLAAVDRGVSAA